MLIEKINWEPVWTLRKYLTEEYLNGGEPFETRVIEGNVLVNEGIAIILQLMCATATPDAFSNANARIGVGNGVTAEQASDTDLAGASKLFRAMEGGYPQVSGQTATWRAVFEDGVAEFAWEEFCVVNGADDTAGTMMNRKTSSEGTKQVGQTWTLDLQLTLS